MSDVVDDLRGRSDPGLMTCHKAADEIEELRACIRALCNELEARKRLSFRVAEYVFVLDKAIKP
jgi:hypothetical protein